MILSTHPGRQVLLFLAILVSGLGGGGIEPWSSALRQGVLALALVGWILGQRFTSNQLPRKKPEIDLLVLLVGLSLVACFVSWMFSGYELSSRIELVDLVLFSGVFLMVAKSMSRADFRLLVKGAVFVGSLYAIHTIYQKTVLGDSRPASTFFNPNFAAGFFLGALGLVASQLFSHRKTASGILWYGAGGLVLLLGIWSTGSRSGFLALIVMGVALIWIFIRKAKWVIIGSFVLCTLFVIIPNPGRDRLARGVTKDPYAFDRLRIWGKTVEIIRDNPLLGVGIGNFEHSTNSYRFPLDREIGRFGRIYRDAHNSYLQVAAEIGIPAALVLLAALCMIFGRTFILLSFIGPYTSSWIPSKEIDEENRFVGASVPGRGVPVSASGVDWLEARGDIAGALLALTGIVFQAFFHEIVDSPPNILLAVLAAGIVQFYWKRFEGTVNQDICSVTSGSTLESRSSKWLRVATVLFLVFVFWPHFSLRILVGDELFKKAADLREKGDVEGAESLFRNAVRINPSQPYFHKALGDLLVYKFESTGGIHYLKEAEEAFQTAASLNKLDPQLVFNLGEFYRFAWVKGAGGRELLDESLSAYRRAVEMSPFNVHYLARLSFEELKRGNLAKALTAAERAVDLEPNFVVGCYLVSVINGFLGNAWAQGEWKAKMEVAKERNAGHTPINDYERLLSLSPHEYFPGEPI